MFRRHPIFDELDAALDGVVGSEPVELAGSWLPACRRTYEGANQLGSGEGPLIDVIDWRWHGELSCPTPIVAVAFLVTSGGGDLRALAAAGGGCEDGSSSFVAGARGRRLDTADAKPRAFDKTAFW